MLDWEFWSTLPTVLVNGLVTDLIKLGFTTLIVSRVLVFIFRTMPSRLRWQTGLEWKTVFQPKPSPYIVLATLSGESSHYRNVFTDMGQVRATAILAPSLNKAYRRGFKEVTVVFSAANLLSTLKLRDVVAIGGAKNNAVSEEVLEVINARLGAGFGMKNIPSERYKDQTVDVPFWQGEPKFSEEDQNFAYGMIIRTHVPGNSEQTLTVLSGAGTHGSEAAAWVLANDKSLVRKIREAGRSKEFVALVKAQTRKTPDGGAEVVHSELEAFLTFEEVTKSQTA